MNAPPDDLTPRFPMDQDPFDLTPDPRLGLAGELFADTPPPELADRVMSAVRARPRTLVTPATPVEALARTIADAAAVFDTLTPAEWTAPRALATLDVKQTVAHLHGADTYLGIKFGAWEGDLPVDEDDHAATAQPAVDQAAHQSGAEVLAAWHERSDALLGYLRGVDPERLDQDWVKFNLIEGPFGIVLIGRSFELWTHVEDVCRATGRGPVPPSPEVLAAMTEVGSLLVPLGYQMAYGEAPVSIRLVLTGAGGGTWNLPLGQGAGAEPAATIVGDVVDFCRLIAGRTEPAELECDITGDRDLAERVLVGATQFVMD
jgi:uncharacterized protein (TIGR03083 family)